MAALLRRIRPPAQTSACTGCGRVITERRRRPCGSCGSINRHVSVVAIDSVGLTDRAQ